MLQGSRANTLEPHSLLLCLDLGKIQYRQLKLPYVNGRESGAATDHQWRRGDESINLLTRATKLTGDSESDGLMPDRLQCMFLPSFHFQIMQESHAQPTPSSHHMQ